MVINEKDIELSKPNRFPPITVKQGDNARQITARLFNDGEQFLVTSGLGVRLNAKRSDGQKNYSTGWVNDDGTITVQITSWMVAVVGTVTCDISVFLNGKQAFTTTNFYLNVEEATNKDGVIGGDDTPIDEQFAEIVLQIEDYVEQAKQYANRASTVDHIIEQNSGVPVKLWATDDKNEFDNLETKQQNTLYVYPSDFNEEAILNGTQKVGHAINAEKLNGLAITKDENGVLRIGDITIPQKRLIFDAFENPVESVGGQNTGVGVDIPSDEIIQIGKSYELYISSGKYHPIQVVKVKAVHNGTTNGTHHVYFYYCSFSENGKMHIGKLTCHPSTKTMILTANDVSSDYSPKITLWAIYEVIE